MKPVFVVGEAVADVLRDYFGGELPEFFAVPPSLPPELSDET